MNSPSWFVRIRKRGKKVKVTVLEPKSIFIKVPKGK